MRPPVPTALSRAAATGTGEMLLYGLTPPPADQLPDKVAGAAHRTRERLARMRPDAVAVYDLVDEPGRSDAPRPFPFTPTLEATAYATTHLRGLALPIVHYRNVAERDEAAFRTWLASLAPGAAAVLVGAGSSDRRPALDLRDAQEILRTERPDVLLGAVTIPERHDLHGDEHERLLAKQKNGCAFFVSQVVYDTTPARRTLEAYAVALRAAGMRPAPIVFSVSLCGSAKQLDLLEWLGVAVPEPVAEALRTAEDPRAVSRDHCLRVVGELAGICRGLGLPFGILVESVSDLRADTDAAVDLAADVAALLRR